MGSYIVGSNGTYTFTPSYNYIYDADGNRISKSGSGAVDHIYFAGRELARLASGQWTDLIYGTSGLLAEVPGTQTGPPVYRMTDHLGTSVGTLDSNAVLLSSSDHAPFGQLFAGGSTDPYKFTGKERDTESGNDYFGARYYASSMGRFMSPDPSVLDYADPTNPQSLNLYSYARNNPLINTDPSGKECVWDDGSYDDEFDPDTGNDPITHSGGSDKCAAQGGNWVDHSFFAGMPDWNPNPADCANGPFPIPAGPYSNTSSPTDNSAQYTVQTNVTQITTGQVGSAGWLWKVSPADVTGSLGGGSWDYKAQGGTQAFGNFNFAATCAALGKTLEFCQRGAGAAATARWGSPQGPGSPTGAPGTDSVDHQSPDYGDQPGPSENLAVIAGWVWQNVRNNNGCNAK
jgi:RHS repeat-associated protein